MTDILELKDRVQRNLSTIEANGVFNGSKSIEMIIDGISAAYDAILPWAPKLVTETITADSETWPVPDDCYAIEAIMDEETHFVISRLLLEPGSVNRESYWVEYPSGTITFNEAIINNCTLYYTAYWDKPTEESDLEGDFEPPDFCITPMAYFATAYVLMPDSVQTSEIRQFGVKSDSGHPEHNPIEKSIKFLMDLFYQGMDQHPNHQRARL